MKAEQMLRIASKKLRSAGIDDAYFDAVCLVEHVTGFDRTRIMLCDDDVTDEQTALLETVILRRAGGEPLQYIIGKWDFFGRTFEVGTGVLIPRPETELIVELALRKLEGCRCPVVFDLCAGSGCIGLSIAAERPDARVYLFEKYDEAYSYLGKNMKRLALTNSEAVRYDIINGYDVKRFDEPDLIVSNPPYIRKDELGSLQPEVKREPVTALDGGDDGADFYRVIARSWLPFVRSKGGVIVECDPAQALAVAGMFMPRAVNVEIVTDTFGLQRAVAADIS